MDKNYNDFLNAEIDWLFETIEDDCKHHPPGIRNNSKRLTYDFKKNVNK